MILFEHTSEPLASLPVFYKRLLYASLLGLGLVMIALLIGMLGYHYFESMTWEDAFVNAAMILSGMGPMGALQTTGGKLFAGCYALFSGLLFVAVIGLVFSPVVHRFLHGLHLDKND